MEREWEIKTPDGFGRSHGSRTLPVSLQMCGTARTMTCRPRRPIRVARSQPSASTTASRESTLRWASPFRRDSRGANASRCCAVQNHGR